MYATCIKQSMQMIRTAVVLKCMILIHLEVKLQIPVSQKVSYICSGLIIIINDLPHLTIQLVILVATMAMMTVSPQVEVTLTSMPLILTLMLCSEVIKVFGFTYVDIHK